MGEPTVSGDAGDRAEAHHVRHVCRGYDPHGYGRHGYALHGYEHRVQKPDALAGCLPPYWKQPATAQEGLILRLSKCEVLIS